MSATKDAIARLESEMGQWGSIAMRLSDEALADIGTVIRAHGELREVLETTHRYLMIGQPDDAFGYLDKACARLFLPTTPLPD